MSDWDSVRRIPQSPDSAQFTVIRYAPRNPKENAAYRPLAVGCRQKSLQSFFLHVCQTKPLRIASVSSIRQTIRASLSLQVILFFQVSGRGTPYQEVVPQYVIGCIKHLKSLSIRGEEIPSFAAHIKDYRIVDSPSSSLEKVNSNSLFCTTHGFHCRHLGLKSFPSADCMQSQLTGSSHRSSNYWPSNIYTPRIHLKANTLKILHLFYPQPFYSRNPLHCKEPTESMLTSVQTEEPEISNQPFMSLS